MSGEYVVFRKPDEVSYEEIADILRDAHTSTKSKGMNFLAASQTAEEAKRRLGNDGVFFTAMDSTGNAVGCGAVVFHKSGKRWFYKDVPYCEVKMVGVRTAHKGRGINRLLYDAMEDYGFSRCDVMVMNTAVDNSIVIDSNMRRGWQIVGYISWSNTNYYSVVMTKWKDAAPFLQAYIALRRAASKFKTYLLRDENGQIRFPFSVVQNIAKA